jgi:dihydrodipicolinate synthase/N-acetylneuraminate lyase
MTLNLSGLTAAQVTPFTEGGRDVDLDWLPAHIEYLRDNGVNHILTLGTNGEGPLVGLNERKSVVEAVVKRSGMMRVLAGVGCLSLRDTIQAANDALDAGADAIALLPSHFFPDADARGLVDYFASVIESIPAQGRVLLHNTPPNTQLDIPDEVVLALLDLFPDQLIGITDSSGDPERTRRYVEATAGSDFQVLAGSDHRHAELYQVGCQGGVSGMANIAPMLAKTILSVHRDTGDASRVQRQLNELRDVMLQFSRMGATKQLIAVVSGLPLTHTRPPNRDLDADEAAALEAAVGHYLVGAS